MFSLHQQRYQGDVYFRPFHYSNRKMLLAAEMLEEKMYCETDKLNNNESSESGRTAEETSD